MDAVDEAQQRELEALAEQLEQQRRAAALDGEGNEICADCGDAIPAERRRAMPSAIRCVHCQAWFERVKTRA